MAGGSARLNAVCAPQCACEKNGVVFIVVSESWLLHAGNGEKGEYLLAEVLQGSEASCHMADD